MLPSGGIEPNGGETAKSVLVEFAPLMFNAIFPGFEIVTLSVFESPIRSVPKFFAVTLEVNFGVLPVPERDTISGDVMPVCVNVRVAVTGPSVSG